MPENTCLTCVYPLLHSLWPCQTINYGATNILAQIHKQHCPFHAAKKCSLLSQLGSASSCQEIKLGPSIC